MNRNNLFFIFVFLGWLIALPASAISLDRAEPPFNKPILVKPTVPEVTFSLKVDREAGYSWFVSSYNNDLISPVSHKFKKLEKNVQGSIGASVWVFRVNQRAFIVPTLIKVKMVYGQPWNMKNVKKRTLTILTIPK